MYSQNPSYNMLNKRIHTNHVYSCSLDFLGSVVYDVNDIGLIHKYSCWAYSYIEGNPGIFYLNGRIIELKPENGIFIPPQAEHHLKCEGPNKMSLIYMGINGITFPNFEDIEKFNEDLKYKSCVQVLNSTLSKTIKALNLSNSPDILNSFSPLILEKVLNVHNFVNAGVHIDTTDTSSYKNIVAEAGSILCEDFSKNISFKELSKRLYLSERKLNKIFLQVVNMSFKEYYLMLKMEYAMHILNTSEISISQAAEILGFCDAPYFSKKFKEYFGKTPHEVQKKYV